MSMVPSFSGVSGDKPRNINHNLSGDELLNKLEQIKLNSSSSTSSVDSDEETTTDEESVFCSSVFYTSPSTPDLDSMTDRTRSGSSLTDRNRSGSSPTSLDHGPSRDRTPSVSSSGSNTRNNANTSTENSCNTSTLDFAVFAASASLSANSGNSALGLKIPLSNLQKAAYYGNLVAAAKALHCASSVADVNEVVSVQGHEFSGYTAREIADQRGHYNVAQLIEQAVDNMSLSSRGSSVKGQQPLPLRLPLSASELDGQSVVCDNKDKSRLPLSIAPQGLPLDRADPALLGVAMQDGYKKPSEDRVVVLPLDVQGKLNLYCVFDGHNGQHISESVSLCLPMKIKHAVSELYRQLPPEKITPELLAELMSRCIEALDAELLRQATRNFILRVGGTTAVLVLESPTHLILANLGDSPAMVVDAISGRMVACTEDHTPSNAREYTRVVERQGLVVSNPEYGDHRMCSPRRTSTVSVTRALGQFEFKVGLDPSMYTVTSRPQLYVWSRDELATRCLGAGGDPSKLFLCVFSDSLTEAVTDSLTAPIEPDQGRPAQIIANIVPHVHVAFRLAAALQRHNYHAQTTAEEVCRKQVELFKIGGSYCGDNTSLILVKL